MYQIVLRNKSSFRVCNELGQTVRSFSVDGDIQGYQVCENTGYVSVRKGIITKNCIYNLERGVLEKTFNI